MSQPDNEHVVRRNSAAQAVEFSVEVRQAMILLEGLINTGDLVLVPDQYIGNRLMFRPACRAPAVETVTATLGEVVGFSLDPLEQAIESTVRMLREEATSLLPDVTGDTLAAMAVYGRMVNHLDALLAEQLKRVTAHG
ncbi:hypothetical protein [Pseudomonas fluorescens]|uniref:Uncharacterized protein n=1 Tax=Pseudomonas fluorescens TaxID=294 RepID=A0A5E7E8V4_PSEFL|nr:hypothetical protein [Pseudomonas fluorescens]VVO23088.1 hypothetical protein PS723_04376 [Pseudomonas fluorescens]